MKTFAFIVSPTTIKQLKDYRSILRILPNFIIKSWIKNFLSFKVCRLKKISSAQGKVIEGYIIVCPLLQPQASDLAEDFVLDRLLAAGHIAKELGARIIGLDGYLSVIADEVCDTLAKNLKIAVTSGNAFTAWSIFEAIYRIAKTKKIELKRATLAVIGADNSIGNLCAKKLSEHTPKIFISGKNSAKLEHLKETILRLNPIEIVIEEANKAVKNADIVIHTDNSAQTAFALKELKPSAIVCAIFPSNLRDEVNLSQDITFIEAGLVKLPFPDKLSINLGTPKGIISASMAETMLLTFEKKFITYSSGENTNLDKLEEIANLAARHGFEVWVPEAPVL